MVRLLRIGFQGIVASLILSLAMPWLSDAWLRLVLVPTAHAEESAPLAAAAELIRRKGFKGTFIQFCDIFHFRPKSAMYNVETTDDEKEVLAKANYPANAIAALDILAEPPTGDAPIVLVTNQQKDPPRTGYAFLTNMNGQLHAVAFGLESKYGKNFLWDWKPTQITPKLRETFAREVRLCNSEHMLKVLREAPDRKD